mmetsp:Transcript_611/g.1466  ORF Transcript_611/g.1466 Transcript_611/m.1466 type:complete len:203 (+) Transcript_611:1104-1712(+)
MLRMAVLTFSGFIFCMTKRVFCFMYSLLERFSFPSDSLSSFLDSFKILVASSDNSPTDFMNRALPLCSAACTLANTVGYIPPKKQNTNPMMHLIRSSSNVIQIACSLFPVSIIIGINTQNNSKAGFPNACSFSANSLVVFIMASFVSALDELFSFLSALDTMVDVMAEVALDITNTVEKGLFCFGKFFLPVNGVLAQRYFLF